MNLDIPAPARVAVIAGTPYDARLGCDLLARMGVSASAYPMASSPDEQDALQYLGSGALNGAFRTELDAIGAQGTNTVMLFCNSLAAVVDIETAGWTSAVDVISPLDIYRALPPELTNIMVITGNGQATVGFERAVMRGGGDRRVLGVSDPALVRLIETRDAEAAFTRSSMPAMLRLAQDEGFDAVVFACTHFTSVLPLAQQACTVPIIDVGSRLVDLTCGRSGVFAGVLD
ncbi:hypothetical protein GCM10010435_24870 [Winogradskya consettensis]|uniref:Glutamate racemase n=1 Tax=Winogradskya consettensis TaxID=113560 RepID=A0A919VLE6_9ACTN|nr:aspartate/glutamate racemase family protein [Actinoplanes consettensis]GIM67749.1 hypothetical protein Aco04nite_07660 [Actinoplanes consettensis]